MTNNEFKFAEKFVQKYFRSIQEYRPVPLLEGYEVGNATYNSESGRLVCIEIKGLRQNYILMGCASPLKVLRPGEPVEELPLFFVMSEQRRAVSKIKNLISYFALRGNELVAYRQDGRGCICEV